MASDQPAEAVDLRSFPVRVRGRLLEDFRVGETIDHRWGRTLTHADNVAFSSVTCSWLPMHLDVQYARAHGHRDVVINPMLVVCTVFGLSVEDLSELGGPLLGLTDCVHHADVLPGDTLKATSLVLAIRPSSSRPGHGIVTWRTSGTNQHGDDVVGFTRANLVRSGAA